MHYFNLLRSVALRFGNRQSYISSSNKIDLVIESLIHNKNFLIEGQNDREEREQIAYKKYRMKSTNTYIFFSRHEIDSGHLTIIGASNPQDGTKKHWEWQDITFNEAQIKQVFPIGGEKTDTREIITKAKIGRPQHPVKKYVYQLLTEHHQNQNATKLRPIEVKDRLRAIYTKDKSDYSDYSEDVVEDARTDFYKQYGESSLAEKL
jgi:hypothetical protein